MLNRKYDYMVKCVLVGEANVGKSSILTKLTEPDAKFDDDRSATIGMEFDTYYTTIDDTRYKIQIWDSAGQEKFYSIVKSYFRGAHIFIFVFDLTEQSTLDQLDRWYKSVSQNATDIFIPVVVGNKIDRHDDIDKSIDKQAREFADSIGAEYMITSALTDRNIKQAFESPLQKVHILQREGKIYLSNSSSRSKSNTTIRLDVEEEKTGCFSCF